MKQIVIKTAFGTHRLNPVATTMSHCDFQVRGRIIVWPEPPEGFYGRGPIRPEPPEFSPYLLLKQGALKRSITTMELRAKWMVKPSSCYRFLSEWKFPCLTEDLNSDTSLTPILKAVIIPIIHVLHHHDVVVPADILPHRHVQCPYPPSSVRTTFWPLSLHSLRL